MATAHLTIDLGALSRNWQALDRINTGETGAVVKANGYGLGAGLVATTLAAAGARRFFVAAAEEGAIVRQALGPGPEIFVFSGHMDGDHGLLRDHALIPLLNAPEQLARHDRALPYGIQLNTGMNRLGFQPEDWAAHRATAGAARMVMSHLACADEPDHAQNARQLARFGQMTEGLTCPRSLAATGGLLLGRDYHFDLARPGIGLYGGQPFDAAEPVVRLSLPVIQTRRLTAGDPVGYGCSWIAKRPTRLATVAGGYADGLIRAMSNNTRLWAGGAPCPLVGRVSMDLITVDVTDLPEVPAALDILCPQQTVDDLAGDAGTIGYEILTSLDARLTRNTLPA